MNPVIAATVIMASIFAISQCDERKDPQPTVTAPANRIECIKRGGHMQTFWYGKFGGTRCVDYQK